MAEFWETNFNERQEMWGLNPCHSAVLAKDFLVKKSVKNILIPGIGYGRNAKPFVETGIKVTGIEISKTAINIAKKHFDNELTIYHGSVTDMPFDKEKYDSTFCYALIHLLNKNERKKLIQECYNQLADGGYMIFSFISKKAHTYGKGKLISKDRYELFKGVKLFFYDYESIKSEFEDYGLIEIQEINEDFYFYYVTCHKA